MGKVILLYREGKEKLIIPKKSGGVEYKTGKEDFDINKKRPSKN